MSDLDIQTLEKRHREAPEDESVLRALEKERIREGLGWFGETLPKQRLCQAGLAFLVPDPPREMFGYDSGHDFGEHGYEYVIRPTESIGATSGAHPDSLRIPMVYVPGGRADCDRCKGTGDPYNHEREWIKCESCGGAGEKTTAPLYLGRFPVTWGEWKPAEIGWRYPGYFAQDPDGSFKSRDRHPVVNISHADALAFCEWAGLKLPTEQQWLWAALGDPKFEYVPPGKYSMSGHWAARRYPWGNDSPSPERCVWAGHPEFGPDPGSGPPNVDPPAHGGSTAPVVVTDDAECKSVGCSNHDGHRDGLTGRIAPARPEGRSWCGAMDMAGNVWEWLGDGIHAAGGSFRSHANALAGVATPGMWTFDVGGSDNTASDEIGFRVVLPA